MGNKLILLLKHLKNNGNLKTVLEFNTEHFCKQQEKTSATNNANFET